VYKLMIVREAQLAKIPYMVIVGDKELTNGTVSLRLRNGEDLGSKQLPEFKARIQALVKAQDSSKL
jgi:threonyl-tRNA synthetase